MISNNDSFLTHFHTSSKLQKGIDLHENEQPYKLSLIKETDKNFKADYSTYEYSTPVPICWRYEPENEFKLTYRIHNSFSSEQVQLIKDAIIYLSRNVWISFHDEGKILTDFRSKEYDFYDPKLKKTIDETSDDVALNYVIFLAFWHYPKHPIYSNKENLLIIDRFDSDPVGDNWKVGHTKEINSYNKLRHCEIQLNGAAMGSSSKYYKATDPIDWAGTILHECFHTFGWDHIESTENAIMVQYEKLVMRGLDCNSIMVQYENT